jgi:hypothetical protein
MMSGHRFSEPCRLMAGAGLVYEVEVWRWPRSGGTGASL